MLFTLSLFIFSYINDNAHLPADHKSGGGNSKNNKKNNKKKDAKDFVSIGPDVNDPVKDNNPVKDGEPADMEHGTVIYDMRVKVSSLAVEEENTTDEKEEETIVDENTGEVMKELTWVDSP